MKRNDKSFSLLVVVCALGAAQPFRFAVVEAADTAFSADMKGWGAFLRGAGSFNLNTAKAAQINADTLRRWKQDLRAVAAEQRSLQMQRESGQKQQIEEARYRLAMQEYQLRVNPMPSDIHNGRALNILVDDLMDPNLDILTSDWVTKAVPLPEGMSVKDLIFGFVPASGASNASKKLSRGVIALSRLDVKGEKWPTVLKDHALDAERGAYETAYAKLRDELVSDKFDPATLFEFDKSLSALADKVKTAIPTGRGFRGEAQKYVTELRAATRMFDAETVDYAKEILVDTHNQDAHTVTELVNFMIKYRLRFENAERSPISRVAYDQVYKAMRQQADLFGIKPPEPPAAPGAKAPPAAPVASDPASQFKLNSAWTDGNVTFTVTERNGDTFRATWIATTGNHRVVSGTVRGNQISWLGKDNHVIKGGPGAGEWSGTITNGKIDITHRNGEYVGHTTLKLRN